MTFAVVALSASWLTLASTSSVAHADTYCPPTSNCRLANFQLTSSPNPSFEGQTVKFSVNLGNTCAQQSHWFTFYASKAHLLNPVVVNLGTKGAYGSTVTLYSNALPTGDWEVNADSPWCVDGNGVAWQVHSWEQLHVVKPRPPQPVQAPRKTTSSSSATSVQITIPKLWPPPVKATSSDPTSPAESPTLASARLATPPDGPVLPPGLAAGLIVAAVGALGLLRYSVWARRVNS